MTSQTLRDARRYEEAMAQNITDQERPEFHLSPRVGWMNDPNGFSYYKDKFHLYYQYYPYDSQWGPMHWGHVVSDDLLHWEYLPSAIAPDMPYDYVGCFSGSAIELPDGKQVCAKKFSRAAVSVTSRLSVLLRVMEWIMKKIREIRSLQ